MPDAVPFALPAPALEAYTWVYEGEHAPASQPPLTRNVFGLDRRTGSEPPTRLSINGYTYLRADVAPAFTAPVPDDGQTAFARWRDTWFPQVEVLRNDLDTFDPSQVSQPQWGEVIKEQARTFGRVFGGVHSEAVGPSGRVAEAFIERYVEWAGEMRRGDAHALLQGFPNRTLDRAIALWELSRLIRSDPILEQALVSWPSTRNLPPVLRIFEKEFPAFLTEYGDTLDAFIQDAPTWRENPVVPLTIIRSYARRADDESPTARVAAQRQRREALETELRTAAAESPHAADLTARLPEAQELIRVREDHNFLCDQRLLAASRHRWLTIGEHLITCDTMERADDVFYYELPELVATLEGGPPLPQTEIERRRQLQTAYRAASPTPVLGKPRANPSVQPADDSGHEHMLRGVAASPGVARGHARVIRSIAEADRIIRGDVLVCGVTSPAWTPYFGIVSALVTDAGGVLSHPAVVAREYGLPAVVGTGSATHHIVEGDMVSVDGSTGIVIVERAN